MQKPVLPGFALSAGMLWLLAGALYKLFEGSPNDLPEIVKEMSPLSAWETMRAAIIVELAVVGLVIAKPRLGWFFLCAAFGVFLAILFPLVQAGESSCGCFGSNVTIKPAHMMGIDGGLMLLIFLSRPWRMSKDAGLGWAGYLPLLAVAVAAPWMKLQAPKLPSAAKPPVVELAQKERAETEPKVEAEGQALEGTLTDVKPAGADSDGEVVLGGPILGVPTEHEPVADILPEFWELRPDTWKGKELTQTDLASFLDESEGVVIPGSHVILYRRTCSVCAEHLTQLWEEANSNPDKWTGEQQLVLIRVIENKDLKEDNLCTFLPEPHQRVSLPALKRGWGLKTPLAFDLDFNNVVQNVQDLSKH